MKSGEAESLAEPVAEGGLMAGKPVHIEFPAGETSRARQFWSSLYGWQWQDIEGPMEYHMTQIVPNETGGAVFPADGDARGLRVYFDVDDINAGIAKVNELGGEAGEAQPVPGMGWFAMSKDTEGNRFGLWQNDTSAPAPGQ
jgi:predicted enzyme related to lactoylglutathione lyase